MKKNIYFTHIPKTGGRSIDDIFYKYKKINNNYVVGESYFRSIIKKKYAYYYDYFLKRKYLHLLINYNNKLHWNISFWHIPLSFWKNRILLEYKRNNIIFCMVRNPYDRVVSDFKYWIKFYHQQKKSRLSKYYHALLKQIEDIYDKDFRINKENMNKVIKKLYNTKKYEYALDGHLIPQYKYVYTIIDKKLVKIVDHVLYFENFETNLKKFKNKYATLIRNQDIQNTHLNPSPSDLSASELTQENKEIIYKYFKIDFEAFYYKKN